MKKYLILFLCFTLCFLLCACGDNKTPDETQPNPTSPTESEGQNNQNNNDATFVLQDVKVDKYLWDKEINDVTFASIKLDKDWVRKIVVGNTEIGATSLTDISNVDNYFYTDRGLCGDLEASYITPKIGVIVSSPFVSIDEDSCFYGQIVLLSTTYNQNSIVENVQFVGVPNIFVNNGLTHIVDSATYTNNGVFGIGSKYSYVSSIIGNAKNSFDTVMEDGTTTTTYIYISDNVAMSLVFTRMTEDTAENGVLTSVTWTPTTIKEALHANIANDPLHGVNSPGTHDAVIVPDGDGFEDESTEPTNAETIEGN